MGGRLLTARKLISDQERQHIVELYKSGVSRQDIGIKMDLSPPTIRKILSEEGYPPKQISRNDGIGRRTKAKIVEMYNLGYSSLKIAEALGISKRSVLNVIKESVDKIERTHKGTVGPEEFIATWQTSLTIDEVAKRLGITVQMAYARASQYRAKGVPLKRYKFGGAYDWDDLAALAETFDDEG